MPVWKDYQWVAPLALELIGRYWPSHPPIYLLGLTKEEAGAMPHFELTNPELRGNWSAMVLNGVQQAKQHFTQAYLIAEEHVPLAPCHEEHLNKTLPSLMEKLSAAYISLMGWDNRRHPSKSPILDEAHYRMMHLTLPKAPRFHLHPALWRLDTLEKCCEISLRDVSKNGSAWHFEKTSDKLQADLPEEWKQGCYQIAASRMSSQPLTTQRRISTATERWIFNKLMAVCPLIPSVKLAESYSRWVAFDNVFCNGPYPMFFSGLLQKGRLNIYLVKMLQRSSHGRELLEKIAKASNFKHVAV